MHKLFITTIISLFLILQLQAQDYRKTEQGIKTVLKDIDLEIQFWKPATARVIKVRHGQSDPKESLSVVSDPQNVNRTVTKKGSTLLLKTEEIVVKVDFNIGQVSLADKKAKNRLTEKGTPA